MSRERLDEEEVCLETSADPIHSALVGLLEGTQPVLRQLSLLIIPTNKTTEVGLKSQPSLSKGMFSPL